MKRLGHYQKFCFSLFLLLTLSSWALVVAEDAPESSEMIETSPAAMEKDSRPAAEDMISSEEAAPAKPKKVEKKNRIEKANAFVAGPDWEFDGFVAGGQDQEVRTMFFVGDLVYLNIGSSQGVSTGDLMVVYKRGNRIKDPQSGKFIGYEVRRAAYARVTDHVDSESTSVRIEKTVEPVELGDLVRRE